MARLRGQNTFVIVITLVIGTLIGAAVGGSAVYYYKSRAPKAEHRLKILAQSAFIPKTVLDKYLHNEKVAVEFDVVTSNTELFNKLSDSSHDYDLVALLSWQIPTAVESQMLLPIKKHLVPNYRYIAADFKHMPHDNDLKYSLPLFWGVNGITYNKQKYGQKITSWQEILTSKEAVNKVSLLNDPREMLANLMRRQIIQKNIVTEESQDMKKTIDQVLPFAKRSQKQALKLLGQGELWAAELSQGLASVLLAHNDEFVFQIPDESTTLWTQSLAICKGTNKEVMAHKFIDYLLRKEVAIEFAQTLYQASTLMTLEYESLHPMLKPSFLRTLPLNKLQVVEPISHMAKQWEASLAQ